MFPGGGSGGLSLLLSGYWPFVPPLVARVRHAAFQQAKTFTATSFSAASITAVVVAVVANADASFTPPH